MSTPHFIVMAGLDPAIHADARHKAGHDDLGEQTLRG
jgi:hypothetical protein